MPWCEPCARYWAPNALEEGGECPTCGRTVAEPSAPMGTGSTADDTARVPWHFWLLVAAVALYLGWRLIQGLAWVVQQAT